MVLHIGGKNPTYDYLQLTFASIIISTRKQRKEATILCHYSVFVHSFLKIISDNVLRQDYVCLV